MSIEDTAMYSDVAPSTIQRIIAHFKETGDVVTSKHSKTQVPSTLCDLDIQVWLYLMMKLVVDMFVSTCILHLLLHWICTLMNYVWSSRKSVGFQCHCKLSGEH